MSDLLEETADLVQNGARSPRSLIEDIKARNAGGLKPLYLPIPRWNGDVVVQYGKVPPKALLATIGTRNKSARASNADLLAVSCVEVFVVDPETGDRTSIGDAGPVRFDSDLAEMFDLGEVPERRDVVLRMYADDTAIGHHAQKIIRWQTGENLEQATPEEIEETLGEEDAET